MAQSHRRRKYGVLNLENFEWKIKMLIVKGKITLYLCKYISKGMEAERL